MTTNYELSVISDILAQNITAQTIANAKKAQARDHQSSVIDMLAGAEQLTDSLKEEVKNALVAEIAEGQNELDRRRADADHRCVVCRNRGECCNKKPR